MRSMVLVGVVGGLMAVGCGGGAGAQHAEEPHAAQMAPARRPRTELARSGTIARTALEETLQRGLGAFLGHVLTEPHLDNGQFVGFRFVELDETIFAGTDLRPGDTLVSVNGSAIERPEQALQVWNSLHVASELTVEYLRDGEPHQLRFAIAD